MSWWTVDPFSDHIFKRDKKPREFGTNGISRRFFIFDTEQEAISFVIERCVTQLSQAMGDVQKIELRLKRARRRLSASEFPSKRTADAASTGVSDARDRESV